MGRPKIYTVRNHQIFGWYTRRYLIWKVFLVPLTGNVPTFQHGGCCLYLSGIVKFYPERVDQISAIPLNAVPNLICSQSSDQNPTPSIGRWRRDICKGGGEGTPPRPAPVNVCMLNRTLETGTACREQRRCSSPIWDPVMRSRDALVHVPWSMFWRQQLSYLFIHWSEVVPIINTSMTNMADRQFRFLEAHLTRLNRMGFRPYITVALDSMCLWKHWNIGLMGKPYKWTLNFL